MPAFASAETPLLDPYLQITRPQLVPGLKYRQQVFLYKITDLFGFNMDDLVLSQGHRRAMITVIGTEPARTRNLSARPRFRSSAAKVSRIRQEPLT